MIYYFSPFCVLTRKFFCHFFWAHSRGSLHMVFHSRLIHSIEAQGSVPEGNKRSCRASLGPIHRSCTKSQLLHSVVKVSHKEGQPRFKKWGDKVPFDSESGKGTLPRGTNNRGMIHWNKYCNNQAYDSFILTRICKFLFVHSQRNIHKYS